MSVGPGANRWDRRIERAQELAARYPFAAEGLRFYESIASFQKPLYTALAAERTRPPDSVRQALELEKVLPSFASFLSLIAGAAPPPLAQSAAALSAQGTMRWAEVLEAFWRADTALPACETLISWTFLQPYAEALADLSAQPEPQGTPSLCPFCSGRPQVGVLRQLGDGAKRSLVCSLCAREWDFRRIVCPACGEESVDKLPVYVAEELGHLRLEACDTCRHFITTIDLTKDGRAVPVVDELAAIPLSLWAAENRYTKWSPNLLGL